LEEEKKTHSMFKANPVPRLAANTPMKATAEIRKTVPEPFNLTQIRPKPVVEVRVVLRKNLKSLLPPLLPYLNAFGLYTLFTIIGI